jgi:uncharacterized protein YjiS (DUF1127 family)
MRHDVAWRDARRCEELTDAQLRDIGLARGDFRRRR